MKVKESVNVTFGETPPPFKTLPLVDDDLDEEEAIKITEKKILENDIVDETLEIDEIVNIKESRNHPLDAAGEKVYAAELQLLEVFLLNRSRIGINKWYQSFALRNFDLEDMEFESTNSGTIAKLPILRLENGDSWVSVPQTAQENGTSVTKMSIPAHSIPSTRDVSPRLCYPPRRAPRRSEAFRHWCATPLSTLYPPTTSESSSGDSSERPLHSSSHYTGPSRKRCRSLVDYVPSSTLVMRSLAPTHADLLPPRKRFRDSYSSEAIIEEDTEIGPIEIGVDMELGIGDGDDARDHVEIEPRDVRDDTEEYEADTSAGDTVEVGVDPMSAPIVEEGIVEPAGEDSFDSFSTRDDIVRSFEDMPIDLDDVVLDFNHHMSEVHIDRIVGIETVQRWLESD
ncbi:hypothetical protein Tco_0211219 [Tanacetum coccineum]